MYSYTLRQHNNSLTILCYVHCHSLSQNDAPLPTATTKKTTEGRLAIDRLKQRLEPQLEQRRCMRTSNAPYRAMLSWQQMASFGVHQEVLDDLPQQRGTRESLLPCVMQSRACAHNITGAGRGGSFPPVAAPPTCITHSACSTSLEQQYGVVQCRSVCSSTVYSRSVECKNNYRLVRVHTSVEY